MSEIVTLEERRKNKQENPPKTITRIVDGELIEYELCEERNFAPQFPRGAK